MEKEEKQKDRHNTERESWRPKEQPDVSSQPVIPLGTMVESCPVLPWGLLLLTPWPSSISGLLTIKGQEDVPGLDCLLGTG